MEVKHPRRILALGAPNSGVLDLLKDLTGTAPVLTTDTTAGLSHTWSVSTKYYTATLPIWIDEIPSVSEWRSEFTKPEAREVISVLGAWVYCFRKPVTEAEFTTIKDTLKAIADVIEKACGYGGADQVCLAVAMAQSTTPYLDKAREEWEEVCMDFGFEFIDATEGRDSDTKGKKNEFGEERGVGRVEEALKANEWDGGEGMDMEDFDDEEFGEFGEGLDAEEREMGSEMFGLKMAINGFGEEDEEEEGGEEDQVEELEKLMQKMVAIKETSDSMTSEAERKRFASKAVNDLMKSL